MEEEGVETMDEIYKNKLERLKKVISFLNPLQVIMGEEALRHLICESNVDLMALSLEKKNEIKEDVQSLVKIESPR